MSRAVALSAGRSVPDTVTPLPETVISRQPIRVGSNPSANATATDVSSGAANGELSVHTSRIVDRPPLPGGNDTPASMRRSGAAAPSSVSASARPTVVHRRARP